MNAIWIMSLGCYMLASANIIKGNDMLTLIWSIIAGLMALAGTFANVK